MKIILAEERLGKPHNETSYSARIIRIGRDPSSCQFAFDSAEWPMVSRQHAEINRQDSRWMLVDTNSTFGTFLDGQKIMEPTEIHERSRIQFGADGPVVIVVRVGNGSEQILTTMSAQPVFIELLDDKTARPRRFEIKNDVTRLGRERGLEVEIDAGSAVVSRRHAEIRRQDGHCLLVDLGSFNGTILNNRRLIEPVLLHDGDIIVLGLGGPTIRVHDPAHPATPRPREAASLLAPTGANNASESAVAPDNIRLATVAATPTTGSLESAGQKDHAGGGGSQIIIERPFGSKPNLTLGRAEENDIRLDGLLISNHHARVSNEGGTLTIEDLNSTNGTYLNGTRITSREPLRANDVIQIGSFVLNVHPKRGVLVFDNRAKTRIDVLKITKQVPNRSGAGKIRLLDDVDLCIQPNEFVGMLGPSGAGKSTLMDSLNGMRPASTGVVLINNLDLYRNLDSLKQSIGYVPQDDIIHRELTVYRTLYYVARLRLSRDTSPREVEQIVGEVMDVTGLAERRDVPISQLSGGQRKRVSIAVELITKPAVIFLDEPTSGLDPATEEKIMKLFRQIAESGRTVILTTHAMENVKLFDKIVVLMRGKLVFYGKPQEALAHVEAESFKDLYDKLEASDQRASGKKRGESSQGTDC
jgi:ABC transport system ATP-binding/permease protein